MDENLDPALSLRDKLIAGFFQLAGWCLFLSGIDPLVRVFIMGGTISNYSALAMVLIFGVILYTLGLYWPPPPPIRAWFAPLIEPIASDFRWWLALVFALWLFLLFPTVRSLQIEAMRKDLVAIHADLKHYVLPRRVSDEENESIIKTLLAAPPGEIEVWFFERDRESTEYADGLFETIKAGGWKASLLGKSDDEILKEQPTISDGLCLDEWIPRGNASDPSVKSPGQVLQEALTNVGIRIDCGAGGDSQSGHAKIVLIVAHHPKVYYPRPKEVPID